MGAQLIDIILFALVALFLVFRLWSVLGRRTGAERPPQMPPNVGRMAAPPPPRSNVVPLARTGLTAPPRPADPLKAGLQDIARADPGFRPDAFVDGARQAFELIVRSFASGDTATLRPLVSDDVYDTFTEVIRHRMAEKETVDTKVVRLQEPQITEARMNGRTAIVVLKFVSGQISVTRDADGKIIEGDPERAVEHTDFWTFSRNTRSSDPNWVLAATGAVE